MPSIDTTCLEDADWTEYAERISNIPLHPSGEMNIYEFYQHLLSHEHHVQPANLFITARYDILLSVVGLAIFMNNLCIAIRLMANNPRLWRHWCCIISSSFGVHYNAMFLLSYTSLTMNCRQLMWNFSVLNAVAVLCNNIILLQKLVLVCYERKWIVYVFAPLMLPQLGFAYIIICCSFFTRSTSGHCITHYPTYLPMYWFATTAPIDILFSACFCRVAFTQYSTFGSMAWKKLAHDGVQTMLLATLCKIVCCICTTLLMGDTMGGTFFVMDCTIVTTILVRHCQRVYKHVRLPKRPGTNHVLHLSQIPTAQ